MNKDIYVLVAEKDSPRSKKPKAIIFETYIDNSSLVDIAKFQKELGGRYGETKIAKLTFLEDSNKQHNIIKSGDNKFIPVTDWNKYHDWPPIGGLRWLIFNEKTNGLSSALKRVGRRVLIDEKKFFEWVNEQGETK
jgi:hypothetical protein